MNLVIGLLVPFLGTSLGAACVFFMKNGLNRLVQKALLGFASGVMVAASVWSLLIPSMNLSADLGRLAFLPAVTGFFCGILFLLFLDGHVPHLHIGCDEPEGPSCTLKKNTMLVLAVTLHNIPEGMAVGVMFAGLLTANSGITLAGAFALSVGIAIQNFPEGAIISLPLKGEGMSSNRAFLYGTLSGVVEPVAAILTVLMYRILAPVLPYLLAFAAGAMMYVVVEELIPETAEGRIQVAKKIYKTASEYGIEPEDIIIDALCLTVSSDSQGAITTLETLRRVRDELHGYTVLGVSNISFGLPQREIINSAFFTMAMQNGLSAAIINPNSEAMMRAYYSFKALMDLDPQCGEYISIYGNQPAVSLGQSVVRSSDGKTAKSGAEGSGNAGGSGDLEEVLGNSIIRGLRDQAGMAVKELLETKDPLDVINGCMIPALDVVGKGFEKGTLFLPQLLMSAEAAKTAFEVIKDKMAKSGQQQEKKGTIILATVKGDIHDIGKNIVKVLLENYSYDVLDLGKDVPPELIVETAVEKHVMLVGLSALMTTTVPSMEETIRQLRISAPWAKVMVGGAVLTQEYADTMGADQYCRDAMASVNYAESVFGIN